MKRLIAIGSAALALTLATTGVLADELGKKEFQSRCAVCHGVDGKGDGPYVDLIKVKVPDITLLNKKYGGTFPFEHVISVIDGRTNIKAHGVRDMPIWGYEYTQEASTYPGLGLSRENAELFAQGRILALTVYIQTLQQP